MNYSSGGVSKLEYASYIAGSLIYLMLKQKDAVGLCVMDDKIRTYLPPSSRSTYLKVLLERMENISSVGKTDLSSSFHDLAERIHRRGLIIVLSDLLEDPEKVLKGLKHFRHKEHEIVVFHILDQAELSFDFPDEAIFSDMESGERMEVDPLHIRKDYELKMEKFLDAYKNGCQNNKIDYYQITTSTNLARALENFLTKRRRVGG